MYYCYFVVDVFEYLQYVVVVVVGGVQFEVEEGEFQLVDYYYFGLEVFCCQYFFQQVLWQCFVGFVVGGDQCQVFWFLVLVFYELVGQFDGVLGYFVDFGGGGMFDVGQQVVQVMVEFVEQGSDFVVGQQCWFVVYCWGEVVYQVGYWVDQLVLGVVLVVVGVVYLGIVVFVGVGIEVEVEVVDVFVVFEDFEQVYVGVLVFEIVQFVDLDVVEVFDDGEQVGKYFVYWEVGMQCFLGYVVVCFVEFFGVVVGVLVL